jgi:hypothetical protein
MLEKPDNLYNPRVTLRVPLILAAEIPDVAVFGAFPSFRPV